MALLTLFTGAIHRYIFEGRYSRVCTAYRGRGVGVAFQYSRQYCALMAKVAREVQSGDALIRGAQLADQLPSPIGATVIDKATSSCRSLDMGAAFVADRSC